MSGSRSAYFFACAVRGGNEEQLLKLIAPEGLSRTTGGGYTLLLEAIRRKNDAITRLLITSGAKVNIEREQQHFRPDDTPLHVAISHRKMDIAGMLLSRGAHIYAIGGCGLSSIGEAIKTGTLEFLELLFNRGVDLNARGPDGLRPLHIAAKKGKEDAVVLLLSYGADIDATSSDNKTALCFAAEKGDLVVVKLLLQFGPDVNNEGNKKALYVAMNTYKDKMMVESLLDNGFFYELEPGCDPNFFHGAIELGFFEIVEDLLKNGADANRYHCGATPILLATKIGQTDIADALVSYGADVNVLDGEKKSPINYAAESGNAKLFNVVLTHGATLIDYPYVMEAAISGKNPEIVEQLLSLVNVRCGEDKDTPLHLMSAKGDHRTCETLLKKGAAVGSKNKEGHAPLHSAGNAEIVRTLIHFGADVSARDRKGRTPLHIASSIGNKNVVEALLKFDVDIDSTDKKGKTALQLACEGLHAAIVHLLLNNSADINISDNYDFTPLSRAYSYLFRCFNRRKVISIIMEIFLHIDKMEMINLHVSDKNIAVKQKAQNRHILSENVLTKQRQHCKEEIGKLQATKINSCNVTYYEFLTKSTSSLAFLMGNENILQAFQTGNANAEKFPNYAPLLNSKYRKAMERRGLAEQCYEIFGILCHGLPLLPTCCLEEIFQNLSNEDLQMFVAGRGPSRQCSMEKELMNNFIYDSSDFSDDDESCGRDYYGWSDDSL